MDRNPLDLLARPRHGIVTRGELRQLGWSDRMIDGGIARGELSSLHPSVYRVAGAPDTWEQRVAAAVLSIGPGAVASHRSAARLWDLDLPDLDVVEVSTAEPRRRAPRGVVVHRLTDEPIAVLRRGIPTTTPMRLLCDLGAVAPVRVVDDAFVQARARRLCAWDAVEAELRAVGRRGRAGTAAIRRVLRAHDPAGRPLDSVAEARVLRVLRRFGVPEPVCQHVFVDAAGAFLARADFAWPPSVSLEFLGYGPHSSEARFHVDRRRVRRLTAAGVDVVEVTWADFGRNDEWVGDLMTVLRRNGHRVGGRSSKVAAGGGRRSATVGV